MNIYGTSLLYKLDIIYNKIDTNDLVQIVKKQIVNFNILNFNFFQYAKNNLNFSTDNLLNIIDCLPNNAVDNHNLNLLMHYFLINEKNILPNNLYLTKEKIEKIVKNTNLLHLTNYSESLLSYLFSNINKTIKNNFDDFLDFLETKKDVYAKEIIVLIVNLKEFKKFESINKVNNNHIKYINNFFDLIKLEDSIDTNISSTLINFNEKLIEINNNIKFSIKEEIEQKKNNMQVLKRVI